MSPRSTSALVAAALSAAALSAAALSTAALSAAPAQAAPVTVAQIPAIGLEVSGLVVPGPLVQNITAETTATRGVTRFAAPGSDYSCSASAAGRVVDINWINAGTGQSGHVRVKSCRQFLNPAPLSAEARTGSGQILLSILIRGTDYSPNAGQPALPGVGTFTAP